jgi:hypothetical protein
MPVSVDQYTKDIVGKGEMCWRFIAGPSDTGPATS